MKDDKKRGVPISKLLILRRDQSRWERTLTVDKEITNGTGYLGIDFIDDSGPFPYYRVSFSDQGSGWGTRDPSQFTLILYYMTQDGKEDEEEIGTGIGWNPAVGRYQEIAPSGEEFVPEIKSPKHIRSSK